ncbi:MAG: hypothetical protein J5507_02275 [Clostridia bacterium]|nr:hypothetical protein [Clostridia bacterium]
MENAADALKIAFAIFVFVTAITILFVMVAKTRETSDLMFYYADKTNFYDHTDSKEDNRTVGYSDVVSTLYRYYTESVAVKVVLKNGNEYNFDIGWETTKYDKDGNEIKERKLNSIEDIEQSLGYFVNNILPKESNYSEEFVEVPITGIYITAVDGSEITLSQGGKMVYITYVEK